MAASSAWVAHSTNRVLRDDPVRSTAIFTSQGNTVNYETIKKWLCSRLGDDCVYDLQPSASSMMPL